MTALRKVRREGCRILPGERLSARPDGAVWLPVLLAFEGCGHRQVRPVLLGEAGAMRVPEKQACKACSVRGSVAAARKEKRRKRRHSKA